MAIFTAQLTAAIFNQFELCSGDMAIKRVCCWKVEVRPGDVRELAYQERPELFKVSKEWRNLEENHAGVFSDFVQGGPSGLALDLVDCDLTSSTVCTILLELLQIWQNWQSTSATWRNSQINVNKMKM